MARKRRGTGGVQKRPLSKKSQAWWTFRGRYRDGDHPYWSALGIFMHTFSHTENILRILLVHRSGLREYVAHAILSGVRVDAAMDYIRRIEESKTHVRDIGPELEEAFLQLKIITKVRNDIMHHGTAEDEKNDVWVTTELHALTPKHVRIYNMSITNLTEMTEDLLRIQAILLVAIIPFFREDLPLVLARAWQYKFEPIPQPSTLLRLRPRRVRKPLLQTLPKSSRGSRGKKPK